MRISRPQFQSVLRLGALILGALVLFVTVVAVTWEVGIWEAPVIVVAESKSTGIGDYEELMAVLRATGRIVRVDGEYSEPFFRVSGHVVYVDDTQVLVFEYPSKQERAGASELISADGSSVGSTRITWTHQANFWARGRVIVQYLGSDQTALSLLGSVLGTPITTHGQASARSN
jgi:hypothetical protein